MDTRISPDFLFRKEGFGLFDATGLGGPMRRTKTATFTRLRPVPREHRFLLVLRPCDAYAGRDGIRREHAMSVPRVALDSPSGCFMSVKSEAWGGLCAFSGTAVLRTRSR